MAVAAGAEAATAEPNGSERRQGTLLFRGEPRLAHRDRLVDAVSKEAGSFVILIRKAVSDGEQQFAGGGGGVRHRSSPVKHRIVRGSEFRGGVGRPIPANTLTIS